MYEQDFATTEEYMSTYLQRYQDGQYEAVWTELTALGSDIRTDEAVYIDAKAVAFETMQRVHMNVQEVLTQLVKLRYVFTPFSKKYSPPTKNVTAYIDMIEQKAGFIPLSINAFLSVVGSVNLMGYFPELGPDGKQWGQEVLPDPLVFEYGPGTFQASFEEWTENIADLGVEEVGPFLLEFSPDEYHKEDISGGPPYSIKLPNGSIDAIVEDEWHQTTFVLYLRECFRWGGFPGLSRTSNTYNELILRLTKNLMPF